MKSTLVLILIVATAVVLSQHIISPGPYVLHPGIIRPTVDSNNNTFLSIPRGGAYVQPLFAINNSVVEVTINLNILGEACAVGDPLILFYKVTTVGEGANAVTINFDDLFFYSPCGEFSSSADLSSLEKWVIPFLWNGENFVSTDIC